MIGNDKSPGVYQSGCGWFTAHPSTIRRRRSAEKRVEGSTTILELSNASAVMGPDHYSYSGFSPSAASPVVAGSARVSRALCRTTLASYPLQTILRVTTGVPLYPYLDSRSYRRLSAFIGGHPGFLWVRIQRRYWPPMNAGKTKCLVCRLNIALRYSPLPCRTPPSHQKSHFMTHLR